MQKFLSSVQKQPPKTHIKQDKSTDKLHTHRPKTEGLKQMPAEKRELWVNTAIFLN